MAVANSGWVRAQHLTGGTFTSVTTKANTVTATTANSLVIVNVYFTAGTPTSVSVTDNASTPNTYAIAVGPIGTTATGGNAIMYQFYGVQVTSGATTVTVNWTGSSTGQAYIEEYTGSTNVTNATIFDTSQSVIQGTASTAFVMTSFAPTPYSLVVSAYSAAVSQTTWTPGGASASGLEMTLTGSYGATTRAVQQHLAAYASETAPMGASSSSKYTGVAGAYKLGLASGFSLMKNFSFQRQGQAQTTVVPIMGTPKSGAIIVALLQNTGSSASVGAPSGYTSFSAAAFNGNTKYGQLCYKISDGTEVSIPLGAAGSGTITGDVWVIEGVDGTTTTDGTAANTVTGTSVTTVTTPNITTTNANDLMLSAVAGSTLGSVTWTTSSTFAQAGGNLGLFEVSSTQTNFHDTAGTFSAQGVIGYSAAFRKRATTALISTISDNFDDNSLAAIWSTGLSADGTQVKEQNQRIEITHSNGPQYNTLSTATGYDLTGTNYYVQLVDAGNQSLASHEAIIGIYLDTNNALWFDISTNSIQAFKKVAGSQTTVGSSLSYSASTHRYFRVREASGTTFLDWATSPYAGWTNLTSLSNPFAVTAIQPLLQTGCYAAEASSSYIYLDNFNLTTTASTGITKSLKYTVKTTPAALTKSVKYTVKTTGSAITKSLRYAINKPTAITKSLRYAVKTAPSLTKSAKYTVKTTQAITKSAKYTIRTSASALTKTLKYTVRTTPAAKTKSTQYTVRKSLPVTKGLQYTIRRATSITKSLQYIATGGHIIQKTLTYDVKVPTSKTKTLKYAVKTTSSLTKTVRYTIIKTPAAITKSARYTVKKANAQTKGLIYTIKRPVAATSKSLRYAVTVARLATLPLRYDVKPSITLHKSLKYTVDASHRLTLGLQYVSGSVDTRTRILPLEQTPHRIYLENGINTLPTEQKSNSIMLQ